MFYFSWKRQAPEEIAQIISQDEQREPYLVSHELVTRQPRPVQDVLALFDPLLGSASAIVEVHHALRARRHVGYDEAWDTWTANRGSKR